jgi:tRNA C32,U32 (ribose-2'-O)-methylase TrmJ
MNFVSDLNKILEVINHRFDQLEENMVTKNELFEVSSTLSSVQEEIQTLATKEDVHAVTSALAKTIETLGTSIEEVIKDHERRLVSQFRNIVLTAQQLNSLKETLERLSGKDNNDDDQPESQA